ncbi:hypothetical protein [Acinetobacter modestus]|uniref:hypothetical protein n=1 Tax=Acinetobacter modestus TaxID=1776740 RepID=UPI0030174FA9
MAAVGGFDKAKKQILRAIESQRKKGQSFAAMDLPYFASADKKLTDQFINDLIVAGYSVENNHIDSSWYGRVTW